MNSEKRDNKTRWNKQDIDKLKRINFEDYTEEDFQRDFNRSKMACIDKYYQTLRRNPEERKIPPLPSENNIRYFDNRNNWLNLVIKQSNFIKVS